MFIAILKYSVGSLLYGGLSTVLFIFLFIFIIKGWYKDAVFKPVSFIVLGILSLIILWNSTIICGALAMKSDIESIQVLIENVITVSGIDLASTVDEFQASEVYRQVIAQHPILSYYADVCDFSGMSFAELPAAMCDTLKEYLNGIIIKNLLWTLCFVVVGAVIVIKTLDRFSSGRSSYRGSRGGRASGRTSGYRGVSSRNNGGRRRTSRI